MNRTIAIGLAALIAGGALIGAAAQAQAQSVGYVTGIPGRDPADDDGFGWGPAYRPDTTFEQPGTPPTPGRIAGQAYRARTGRGVYDDVQAPLAPYAVQPGYYEEAPPRMVRKRRVVRYPARHHTRRVVSRRSYAY